MSRQSAKRNNTAHAGSVPGDRARTDDTQDAVSNRELDVFKQLILRGPQATDWQTELEEAIQHLNDAPYVVAVTSGSVAMHSALAAADLQPEDEVIIPAYLPPSIPAVIRQFDAHPVLVDIDPDSAHLDVSQVSNALTDRTRAVVAVDIAGLPANSAPLRSLCRAYELLLIEDALAAPPGIIDRPELATNEVRIHHCLSSETCLLSSGAVICTADVELHEKLRRQLAPLEETVSELTDWPATRSLHYADRMTELAAVWKLVSLKSARDAWRRRCQIAMSYTLAFSCLRELQEAYEPPDLGHAWLEYPLRLNLQPLGVTRDEFTAELRRRGVRTSVPCLPINLMPYYQERYHIGPETFPIARNEFLRRVCLPVKSEMSDEDVDRVIDAVTGFATELRHRRTVATSR